MKWLLGGRDHRLSRPVGRLRWKPKLVPLSLQVAERPKLIVHCITAFTVASVAVMCSMWVLHRPPVTPAADPDAAHDAVR